MLIFHSFLMFFVCLPEGKYLEIAIWSSWSDGRRASVRTGTSPWTEWVNQRFLWALEIDESWYHDIWIMILLMVKRNPINHQADGISTHWNPFWIVGFLHGSTSVFNAGRWVDLAPLFRAASDFRCDLVIDGSPNDIRIEYGYIMLYIYVCMQYIIWMIINMDMEYMYN